ncbi:hypothetical protein F5Y10DRAFT_262732 [Nemania abortiva]|nr:hypothetical protein F5Y10DRAFT_262732 [Nemania abortiva]
MKVQAVILALLAALGTPTVLSTDNSPNPAICRRAKGIYDVCDTLHSFARCKGHNVMLIADCKLGKSNYCRIVHDRGSCDGTTPPKLPTESPSYVTASSAAALPSTRSI